MKRINYLVLLVALFCLPSVLFASEPNSMSFRTYDVGPGPTSVFATDLDGDGDVDLAVANGADNGVSVLKNNGDGTFSNRIGYPTTPGGLPLSIFASDLDGDTDQDIVVANAGQKVVSILKNNGDGTFAARVEYDVGYYCNSVFASDLDGDGDRDLAMTEESSYKFVLVLKNNGDGTFQGPVNYSTGNWPRSVFCADLDGDADLDLAVANSGFTGYIDSVSILKNDGDGTFQTAVNYGIGDAPISIFCTDLDGDGDQDLAVSDVFDKVITVLKNNGDGSFDSGTDYPAGEDPISIFASDLDNDGDQDLAVTNFSSNKVSVLKNNGVGAFTAFVEYWTGPFPFSLFVSDLDGDAYKDLVITNALHNTITILMNNGDGTFCTNKAGDANNDGRFSPGDIVYTINYIFRSGQAPVLQCIADMNLDGEISPSDLIYLINFLFKRGPAPLKSGGCCL